MRTPGSNIFDTIVAIYVPHTLFYTFGDDQNWYLGSICIVLHGELPTVPTREVSLSVLVTTNVWPSESTTAIPLPPLIYCYESVPINAPHILR
ncbi:unnamed protein product [Rhizoctonia solani]|uniref:Uncharacterized protein n=1 Tax=Rhizoctonia solani TaxID=456999 RepID=A0A8H3GNX8_9AGAM|nr:unnamed protein product [Rhizoctonia solani]